MENSDVVCLQPGKLALFYVLTENATYAWFQIHYKQHTMLAYMRLNEAGGIFGKVKAVRSLILVCYSLIQFDAYCMKTCFSVRV